MGKGSRNREVRIAANQANNSGEIKLSKRQLIRLEEKKARIKKMVTMGATIAILIAIIVTTVAVTIGKTPDLEGTVGATSEVYGEIDNGMIAYFMYSQYQSFVNENYYYLNYYQLTPGVSLKQQTVVGSQQTWFAFFLNAAESQIDELVALASAAEKAGMSLGEKELNELEESMAELRTYAKKNGYKSLTKYFSNTYVNGLTEASVMKCMKLQKLAGMYYDKLLESYKYEDADFEKYLEENPDKFMKFDYMYYQFKAVTDKNATDDQKKEAYDKVKADAELFKNTFGENADRFGDGIVEQEKLAAAAKNPSTSDTPSSSAQTTTALTTSGADTTVGSDGLTAEEKERKEILDKFTIEGDYYDKDDDFFVWAFEEGRAVGDVTIVYDDDNLTCTVYFLTKTAYKDEYNTQDVRHILFLTSTYGTKEEAKKKAEEVLALYNAGEKTPEAFAQLALEYTDDGNGEKGGLYENVLKGQMVTEFEDWIYDEKREAGEVEIVFTKDYGYHIMYYVGEGQTAWKVTADNYLKNDAYTADIKSLMALYPVEYNYDNIVEIP